ncbi:hypothetical protein GGE12_004483 [Rhizobium mongolense]|uniref:Uncharacterized protein n=1 Tax=Rhizobium mongolense TaxID=57676 RepID=A0A7W6RQ98_9HYPH|nr:hypothetical protein [Rhizobium mongolense]
MQVGMVQQILPPGVQYGEEADLGAEMLGVGGDGAQRLGGGAEEQAVDERLVLVSDGGDGLRQCEDDVKVLCVEQLGATILQPLRTGQRLTARTMPVAAAVEGDAPVAALIARFDVSTERSGAAQLDRRHDAALCSGQRCVLGTIGLAVATEYIRHFRPRTGHRRSKILRLGGRRGRRRTRQ